MIIWLNGTFGVGKTSTARALCEDPSLRLFDPEFVGYMLASQLKDLDFDDFQDLPPWRALVPTVAEQVHALTDTDLVAVQSVLRADYWAELQAGLEAAGLATTHVVLDCERSELRRRIETDQEEASARDWRLEHLDAFEAAKPWMIEAADLVIDTTELSVAEVAAQILRHGR